MANYWIFVVNDWKDSHGKKWSGRQTFDILVSDKVWGLGEGTPHRKRIESGDKVVFYLAGPEGQCFIGSAQIATNVIELEKFQNIISDDSKKILGNWNYVISLNNIVVFQQPRLIRDIASNLEFIANKESALYYFMAGVRAITEADYHVITSTQMNTSIQNRGEDIVDESSFVLEKYLQEFIVDNIEHIHFGKKLKLYSENNESVGSQYPTDVGVIDILTLDSSGNFVILELKKGRESDKVVGQILRYMGWVKKNLAKNGQTVEGIIICKENDEKLDYAISATTGIVVKHYSIDFKLQ